MRKGEEREDESRVNTQENFKKEMGWDFSG
jgi:hypothetical protein